MSFESPMFSFDQRQPPTPTRTPTSPSFTDIFRTPKPESTFYDPRVTWTAADLSATGSSLLKTPKPGSFGSNSAVPQHGDIDFLANAQHLLATPDFSALPIGSSFGSDTVKETASETITQPALSLDTSVGGESSSSIQTPPPTSTSASKRSGKKAQTAHGNEVAVSPSRRKSVPILPKPANVASAVEVSPGELGLDFSPAQFGWAPATAPVYPQQKLFWDPAENESMSMDMSFHQPRAGLEAFVSTHPSISSSQKTITEDDYGFGQDHSSMSMITSTMNDFDEQMNQSMQAVDPSVLFSSAGGSNVLNDSNAVDEALQPYAYQLREAQREKAYGGIAKMKRRRKPSADSPAVQAAMLQLREDAPRPALQRSMTDVTMSRTVQDSIAPRATTVHGRSSPVKAVRSALKKRNHPHRTSIALTIDEHGRARAELGQAEDMDVDTESESSHAASSDDDIGTEMVTSFTRQPGPKLGQFGKSSKHSQKASTASFYSTTSQHDLGNAASSMAASLVASKVREPVPDDESEAETVLDSDEDSHAQSELRKTMQDRQQRNTAHHLYSPQGTSTAFFPNDDFTNLPPGTISDPDLPLPYTGIGPGHSEIRCVCNSALDDGQMLQCESCQKWLHISCTGLSSHRIPSAYVCIFCSENMPSIMTPHDPIRQAYRSHASGSSSLARKNNQYR